MKLAIMVSQAGFQIELFRGDCSGTILKTFLEIVKTLIDHGADVNVRGLDGDTPLHDAAVNGHEEITIVLIQSGGNPESENDKKETPIEVAEEEETRRLWNYCRACTNCIKLNMCFGISTYSSTCISIT